MNVTIEETQYKGWKAMRLDTGRVELVVPMDVGPRVISCRLDGGANLFANVDEEMGTGDDGEWHLRGGHRLWHSPEAHPRTYEMDNFPIKVEKSGSGLVLHGNFDKEGLMRKKIVLEATGETAFRLTHELTSENPWPVRCAPWALTVMAYGGYAVMPLLPRGNHETDLLPNYTMVPWTYTDFSNPCWDFHRDYIGVRTEKNQVPQKLGLTGYPGWLAYWQEAGTFVKKASTIAGAEYPDFGSQCELFCCDFMCELETLGPLVDLEPGATVTHTEEWAILGDLPRPDSDEAFNNTFAPAVRSWAE